MRPRRGCGSGESIRLTRMVRGSVEMDSALPFHLRRGSMAHAHGYRWKLKGGRSFSLAVITGPASLAVGGAGCTRYIREVGCAEENDDSALYQPSGSPPCPAHRHVSARLSDLHCDCGDCGQRRLWFGAATHRSFGPTASESPGRIHTGCCNEGEVASTAGGPPGRSPIFAIAPATAFSA
jgi:hypothetical protein